MDLTSIDVFLKVAEELHFGQAAEQLNLSQPRVSRIIHRLEREVGGALFERSSRRVGLTPLGARLRDALGKPYADLRTAFDEAREAARGISGVLRIGGLPTTIGPDLTELVQAFELRHRTCRLAISEVEIFNPYRALRANEIDVLITWLAIDEADLVTGPVLNLFPRAVVVAARHPLARRSSVSIEHIAEYPVFITRPPFPSALMDAFNPPVTPSGKPIRRDYEVRSIGEAVQAVASGRIVHITVDGLPVFRRPDVVVIPVSDMPPMPLGLVWRRADENRRIRALAQVAATLHKGKSKPA